MHSKYDKDKSNPSTGVQGMMNRRFWGKKQLKPKGKALKKEKLEKEMATADQD